MFPAELNVVPYNSKRLYTQMPTALTYEIDEEDIKERGSYMLVQLEDE